MNEHEGVPLVSGFAVELPAFTGPFRVLSDLILQQKVDVCDVAIGSITPVNPLSPLSRRATCAA